MASHESKQPVKRLFLVDDEPLVLRALERTLRQEGYEIRSFSGPVEALAALRTDRPDCIISDYYMPRTDGLMFFDQVQSLYPEVSRVLLTGGHIDDRVHAALEHGGIHVLIQKPWHLESLREMMEHVRAGRKGVSVLRRSKQKLEERPACSRSAPEIEVCRVAGATVLVVDDNVNFLDLLKTWLERLGYRTLTAQSLERALEIARATPPDVMIVDLIVPGHNGIRLVGALRDLYPRVPVVAITGSRDRNLAVEAFRQGATCFLYKPFELDTLEATIHRCLQLGGLFSDGLSKPEISAVMEVHHAIASGMTGSRLLDILMQEMIRYTRADAASVLLVEPGGETMRIAASFGLEERVVREERVVVGEGISGWVVEHNESQVVIGSTEDDPRLRGKTRKRPASAGMCLPMRGRDRVVGALCVTHYQREELFSRDAVDLGILLAGEVARALDRAEVTEKKADLERSMMRRDKLVTIGELASGVAHEINNPLGFVNSNISSMQEYLNELIPVLARLVPGDDGPDARAAQAAAQKIDLGFILQDLPVCLNETLDGLKRVLKIVGDLKNFARDDTEEKEVADINQIIDGAVNILWNQIKYKAELVREFADLPGIPCYPSQLGQVFLNLLHNAAQAIESDGRIVVRTQIDNGRVLIEVEDNGNGMRPEVLEKVFEPFYTTKPRGVGTGLGLSIAKKIIGRHAGTIDVTSGEGRGTSFRIEIPVSPEEPAVETDSKHG
jgi:signal transduction histidine kinase/DNA-binding response OmpR family regulator